MTEEEACLLAGLSGIGCRNLLNLVLDFLCKILALVKEKVGQEVADLVDGRLHLLLHGKMCT